MQKAEAEHAEQRRQDAEERRHWEEGKRARGEWTEYKSENEKRRKLLKEEQVRRLLFAEGDTAGDQACLAKLTVSALKRVCAANALLVSGTKPQLCERLVGCRRHGRHADKCPMCKHAKFELCYDSEAAAPTDPSAFPQPNMVKCKHMKGMGRPCGYAASITSQNKEAVLKLKLADSPEGDLRKAGMEL